MKTYKCEPQTTGNVTYNAFDGPPGEYVPAEVARGLLEALKKVQWANEDSEDMYVCPLCGGRRYVNSGNGVGHFRDCIIGSAIAKAEGGDHD